MARLHDDPDVLRAALAGYQHEMSMIEQKMEEIRRELAGRVAVAPLGPTVPKEKRSMSAAARRRIAAAQKKRWAAYKKNEAAEQKTTAKRRQMSEAGRKRIAEATKKRWAAFRAAKAATAAA